MHKLSSEIAANDFLSPVKIALWNEVRVESQLNCPSGIL
jgi:hypothetical protein